MTSNEEKYKRHLENIKKANKKYIETHREIINEKRRLYYHQKYASDPEYIAKKKAYCKEYYLKKKEMKLKEKQENEQTQT